MKKIMVIGCPGSGKSTFSKLLGDKLDTKVLHLDYIYHIDNFKHISKDEFKEMITSFVTFNDKFIIDGNYGSTMEWRMQFCDTVVLLDIETEICLKNVLLRMEEGLREDMAPGFDNSVLDENFIEFVKNFKTDKFPKIVDLLSKNEDVEKVVLHNYLEMEEFIQKAGN